MTEDTRPVPIIVGSGRSGTTWVQDAVARANGYATAFEPLHPDAVPAMAPYSGRYLPADDHCEELESFLKQVFSGQARNTWINYRVRPDRLKFRKDCISNPQLAYQWIRRWWKLTRQFVRYRRDRGKPVLTKFIRANLMLPWLLKHFDARIAALVRHPGAVVESKMRLGGDDWEPEQVIDRYVNQPGLKRELLGANDSILQQPLTIAGKHALIWCIENKLIIEHAAEWGIVVGYYEVLLDDPDQSAWQSLVNGLGLTKIPDIVSRRSASQQASRLSSKRGYDSNHFSGWRSRLSSMQINQIQQVLDAFEIHQYNMSSVLPIRRAA